MLEGYVEIKDMKDYYINKQGEVISMKSGTLHKLKPWKCKLIFPDDSEKEFEYCTQIQNYIKENNLNVNYHSLRYYGESRGFKLIKM